MDLDLPVNKQAGDYDFDPRDEIGDLKSIAVRCCLGRRDCHGFYCMHVANPFEPVYCRSNGACTCKYIQCMVYCNHDLFDNNWGVVWREYRNVLEGPVIVSNVTR